MRISLLENKSNWMKTIPDNTSLAMMSIPGTHDSCARKGIVGGIPGGKLSTQHKGATIPVQLEEGIRYLDMRCYVVNGFIEIVHGKYDLLITLRTVLSQCNDFLKKNSSETILMRIKQERSTVSDAEFIKVFNNVASEYRNILHQSTAIPELKNVRGKIVIISNVHQMDGIAWGSMSIQDNYKETGSWKIASIKKHINTCISNNNINKKNILHLNHTSSAAGITTNPFDSAIEINESFESLLEDGYGCDKVNYIKNESPCIGIIAMDFYQELVVNEIIKRNRNGDTSGLPVVKIKNLFYNRNIRSSTHIFSDKIKIRHEVFCWMSTSNVADDAWVMITDNYDNNKKWFLNTFRKELLYTGNYNLSSTSKHVGTRIRNLNPKEEGEWNVKLPYIMSILRKGYLHARGDMHSTNNREVGSRNAIADGVEWVIEQIAIAE